MLWVIRWLEWTAQLDLGFLGILPRTLTGTMGIVTAPLVHGDWLHLISNTFPLLILGISVFYFYHRIALEVFGWIYFMSGFWVWMAAREAYHIGASGIVYGLVTFLFFSGLFRRDMRSLSVSLLVIFLYGGMIQGIFPGNEQISWESHFLGSLAGLFCAFFYRADREIEEETTEILLQPALTAQSSYRELQQRVDLYALEEMRRDRPSMPKPKPFVSVEHTYINTSVQFLPVNAKSGTAVGTIKSPFQAPVFSKPNYKSALNSEHKPIIQSSYSGSYIKKSAGGTAAA
jgi:membrane associated rhomboid family serine protease